MAGKKQKPIIGITPAFDEAFRLPASPESFYLRRSYTRMLASVDAIPIILNPDMPLATIISMCDGIVISGGEDIPADYYGATDIMYPIEPRARIEWERQLIRLCDAADMHILGVCYGMQLLAVHYGGVLHQDISVEVPESIEHWHSRHTVELTEDFLGFPAHTEQLVESRHHHAVARLPENFVATAYAPDGIIEAMRGTERHFGLQWHPESDETGVHIYRAFIERCQAKM